MSFLPPTHNVLDHETRGHLVRSARKLEAVLGATPRLVEKPRTSSESDRSQTSLHAPDSISRPSSRSSNRSARVYSSSRASFISFDDMTDSDYENDSESSPEPSPIELPKASLALRHPRMPTPTGKAKKGFEPSLFLELHAPTQISIAFPSPDARTAVPFSPVSPSIRDNVPEMASIEARRRQMASKLTRTLGENIPPELVFTPTPRSAGLHGRVRSNSWDGRGMVAQRPDPAPYVRDRSPSNVYQTVHVQIPHNINKCYSREAEDSLNPLPSKTGGVRRGPSARVNGREYSGEWSHEMNDVMSRLRSLKA